MPDIAVACIFQKLCPIHPSIHQLKRLLIDEEAFLIITKLCIPGSSMRKSGRSNTAVTQNFIEGCLRVGELPAVIDGRETIAADDIVDLGADLCLDFWVGH